MKPCIFGETIGREFFWFCHAEGDGFRQMGMGNTPLAAYQEWAELHA